LSTDPVAADAASAMVLAKTSGFKSPSDIRYIKLAVKWVSERMIFQKLTLNA
jgi:hypothetical protein